MVNRKHEYCANNEAAPDQETEKLEEDEDEEEILVTQETEH